MCRAATRFQPNSEAPNEPQTLPQQNARLCVCAGVCGNVFSDGLAGLADGRATPSRPRWPRSAPRNG